MAKFTYTPSGVCSARLDFELEDKWGKVPAQEYSYEKLESITKYYLSNSWLYHTVSCFSMCAFEKT